MQSVNICSDNNETKIIEIKQICAEDIKNTSRWINYVIDIDESDFIEISAEIKNNTEFVIRPEFIRCSYNGIYYTNDEFVSYFKRWETNNKNRTHSIKYYIKEYYLRNLCNYNAPFFNIDVQCSGYYILSILSYVIRDLKDRGYKKL